MVRHDDAQHMFAALVRVHPYIHCPRIQISTTAVLEVTEKEVVKKEVAELNAFATAVKERSKHLLPLYVAVPICLPEDSSLLQLQRAVWTGLQGEAVASALRGVLPSWKGE